MSHACHRARSRVSTPLKGISTKNKVTVSPPERAQTPVESLFNNELVIKSPSQDPPEVNVDNSNSSLSSNFCVSSDSNSSCSSPSDTKVNSASNKTANSVTVKGSTSKDSDSESDSEDRSGSESESGSGSDPSISGSDSDHEYDSSAKTSAKGT
ncbi:uncharacterized protein, partial [Palaemon carinicauda]|uniref:uncharacterized protein n=1 Tax=Palaemon carinicauda TaxID=392227 RepID=UPI0035B626A4